MPEIKRRCVFKMGGSTACLEADENDPVERE